MPDGELICSMAGNAFSGYALFPVLSSLFSAMGALPSFQESRKRRRTLQTQLSCESATSCLEFD
jgi:hypothetical protein